MSTALLLVAALLAAPGPGTPMAQIGPRTVKLAEVDKAAADTLKAAQARAARHHQILGMHLQEVHFRHAFQQLRHVGVFQADARQGRSHHRLRPSFP